MKYIQHLFLPVFLLTLTMLVACQPSNPTPTPALTATLTQATSPTQPPSTTPIPTDPPATATPLPAPLRDHYQLTVQYDDRAHQLEVNAQITFTNATNEIISELRFLVEPQLFPNSFLLHKLTWGDGSEIANPSWERNLLTLPLPSPLSPGQTQQVIFEYTLNVPYNEPNTARPLPFGYTERQTNLVDWYPFLPPYQPGKGWLAHPPGYYGEHAAYSIADFDVSIELINPPPNLIIAASAQAEQNGSTYTYQHTNARNFVWSASSIYQVYEEQVGSVTVRSYAFPFNPAAGQRALLDTVQALQLANELFSPYPHTTLSVVQADFLDGMEYDGLYFLSRGFYNSDVTPPRAYLTLIAAHETSHQWWYGRIGNDQALEPWLDESMATYFERIYLERYYPEDLDWWWATRIHYFQPEGWINLPLHEYSGYTQYRNAVYLNGALFLEQIRVAIGDEAFFAFLKDYASRFDGQQVTAQDFFLTLEAHAPNPEAIAIVRERFFKP